MNLDSGIVIDLVQNRPSWGQATAARISDLKSNGDQFAVSDLTRLECRVGPLMRGDAALLKEFDLYFALGVQVVSLSATVCDRAAEIRARYRFKVPDAIHLAAAETSGARLFLTRDRKRAKFTELPIEVLE